MIYGMIYLADIYKIKLEARKLPGEDDDKGNWVLSIVPQEYDNSRVSIHFTSIEQIDEFIKALQELKKMGGKE